MNVRRCVAGLVSLALLLVGWAGAPLAAPEMEVWLPGRVRALVLHVEREMGELQLEQTVGRQPVTGTCHGDAINFAIKKSAAMPRIRALVTGKAETCYIATYLGCDAGAWFARSLSSRYAPARQPFTRSKVTIIEQTPERVVADVAETAYANVDDFVAMVSGEEDDPRPFTDAEVAAVKDKSRYTITRGQDGIWRISDRKPSFSWVCKNSPAAVTTDE